MNNNHPSGQILDRAIGAMIGAACGDALGWPNERSFNAGDGQTDPRQFKQWSRFTGRPYYPHEEVIKAGEYSDDTQLILCVARALQHGEEWWQYWTCAELPFWTLYERGGGGATKRAADGWIDGIPPWIKTRYRYEKDIQRYFDAGGNGVAMRILPHAIKHANAATFSIVSNHIMIDGIATHGHPRALVGALGYGYALWKYLKREDHLEYGEIIEDLLSNKSEWAQIPDIADTHKDWLFEANNHLVDYQRTWDEAARELESYLIICRNELAKGALTTDDDTLRQIQCFDKKVLGAGTVAAAAAVYLASRYAPDPIHGVIKAAFAIGSDTDTIASMTGGLLGVINGSQWLSSLRNTVQDSEYLSRIASSLVADEIYNKHGNINPSGLRTNLKDLLDIILEKPNGETITLPDGRSGIVSSENDYIGRSGKYKVQFRKVLCDDGQTFHFKKVSRGTFQSESSKVPFTKFTKFSNTQQKRGCLNFSPKLIVYSLEKAVWFYKDMLGLRIMDRTHDVVVFEQGPTLVPKSYAEKFVRNAAISALLYVETYDIESRFSTIKDNGLVIITPMGTWEKSKRLFFRCYDPDNNIVEVFSVQ